MVRKLNEKVQKESPKLFKDFKDTAEKQIREKVDLAALIEEKINSLKVPDLENLVIQVASRELKAIEWLGLILGFIIGLIQGLVSLYIL